jgi:hypothetical protein
MWQTRCEARNAVTWKLVQGKTHEEGGAEAYDETVVNKKKLISRS